MHLLFDLDGTIADSLTAIQATVDQTLADLQLSPVAGDEIRRHVGASLRDVFHRVMAPEHHEFVDAAVLRYRELFEDIGMARMRMFDGIDRALAALARPDYTMQLVTARSAPSARRIVHDLNLAGYFDRIHAPEPAHRDYDKAHFVRAALEHAGAHGENAVMVGDRADDVRAALAHGAVAVGVTWGNGSRAELEEAGADFVVESVDALVGRVRALRRAL